MKHSSSPHLAPPSASSKAPAANNSHSRAKSRPPTRDHTTGQASQKPFSCQIPLLAAFLVQVIVVAAAFASAIVVLSEQQRSEFRDALYKQLTLQQESAMDGIVSPLIQRKNAFLFFVKQYLETPGGYGIPNDDNGFADMQQWVNHFYIIPQNDPLVLSISMVNQSTIKYPDYPNQVIWTQWYVEKNMFAFVSNETGYGCLVPRPVVSTAGCGPVNRSNPIVIGVTTVTDWGDPMGFRAVEVWGPPSYINNTITGLYRFMSFTYTVDPKARPLRAISITYLLTHADAIMSAAVVKPTSRNAVFYQYYRYETALTEYFLVSGIFDFPAMSDEITPSKFQSRIWRGGETPDKKLNAAFEWAMTTNVNRTGGSVTEISVDGVELIATAARVYEAETELDFLLVQYTPRHEFFGASDRTRLVGIMIGVAGALLVLISCVLIWLAIHRPLQRLHSQMALAAEMRNDEVRTEEGRFNLKEIRDLRNAFLQMNRKLLRARPFLPQSLLAPEVDEDGDETSAVLVEELPQIYVTERIAGDGDGSDAVSSKYVVRSVVESNAEQGNSLTDTIKRNIGKKIEYKYVGVLVVNVKGFHETVEAAQPHEVSRWQTALTSLMGEAAAEERGILDYFQGDHFSVSFNAARSCPDPSRSGARASVKIWERFRAHNELAARFPCGVSMGLSAGRAAVGNQGTDTMKRLATVGQPYTEAARLQEVMSRRVLGGRLPEVGGRCLVLGRLVQDISSNMLCQVVGGLEAAHVLPSVHYSSGSATHRFQQFAASHNESAFAVSSREQAMCTTDPNANGSVSANGKIPRGRSTSGVSFPISPQATAIQTRTSVLVAVVLAVADSKLDEWYYRHDQWVPRNPHNETNNAICRLWWEGVKSELPAVLPVSIAPAKTASPSVSFAVGRSKGPLAVVASAAGVKYEYDPNAPRAPIAVSPQNSMNSPHHNTNLEEGTGPNSFPSAYSSEGEPLSANQTEFSTAAPDGETTVLSHPSISGVARSPSQKGIRRLRHGKSKLASRSDADQETSASHDCTDTNRPNEFPSTVTADGAPSDAGESPSLFFGPAPPMLTNFLPMEGVDETESKSRSGSQPLGAKSNSQPLGVKLPVPFVVASPAGVLNDVTKLVRTGSTGASESQPSPKLRLTKSPQVASEANRESESVQYNNKVPDVWLGYIRDAMALPTAEDTVNTLLLRDQWA